LRTKDNKELAPNPKVLAYFLYKAMKKALKIGVYEDRSMRRFIPFLEEKFKFFDCPWMSYSAMDFGKNGEIGGCQAFLAERTRGRVFNSKEKYIKSLEEIRRIGTVFNEECNKCPALGICGGVCPYHSLINKGKIGLIDNDFCTYVKETLRYFIDYYYKAEVSKFMINELEDSDFKQLFNLFTELKKTSIMSINDPEELAASMLKIKELNYGKVIVLKERNKIIGFANCVFKNKEEMEIGIGLLSDYRRKGFGKKLLRALIAKIETSYPNKKNILLKAVIKKQNTPSIKLFESFGFSKKQDKQDKNKIVVTKKLQNKI